jgi:hypothetical protein
MKPNQREPEAGEPNYQPNPQEVAALERYLQAAAEKAPRMKVLDAKERQRSHRIIPTR